MHLWMSHVDLHTTINDVTIDIHNAIGEDTVEIIHEYN